ncbi:MAG: LSM domain-containing protein [Candidatus Helarchaeota archaeon]
MRNRPNRENKYQKEPKKERNPLKILNKAVNNLILVRLKDGREYIGRLLETDVFMNLVLTSAEELEKDTGRPISKYGEIFIRGNNILFIKPDYTELDRGEY